MGEQVEFAVAQAARAAKQNEQLEKDKKMLFD
jgi:hypothetical protein